MARLSPAMLAELQSPSGEYYWLQRVSYPGASKQYADRTVASRSLGLYPGKVLKWGTYVRGSMDRAFSLEPTQLSLTIDDTDGFFASLIEGVNGLSIEDSAAVTTLCSPNVDPADWFTLFTSIIEEFSWESTKAYSLRLRSDDRPLRREFPKETITQATWPNADPSVLTRPVPLLYGELNSGGNGGAVPCLSVDRTGFRYMVCAGRAKNVLRVFRAKVQVTSGFSIVYAVERGRLYTLIVFTTSQGEDAISADVEGYETVGDGSGTLITNPMDEIAHALANWIYGDYQSGLWLPTSTAPLDAAWLTTSAAFLAARGHKASKYEAGTKRRKGIDLVNEWCRSFACRSFWSNLGQIIFRFEDHGVTDLYSATRPWLKWNRDLGDFKLRYDTQQRIDRVNVSYLRNEVEGQFTQGLEVRDPRQTKEAPDSLDMAWSHGAAA